MELPHVDGGSWIGAFRAENHRRLARRSDQLTQLLAKYNIKYLVPTSGMFVWIDLSKYLPGEILSPEGKERDLYKRLVDNHGLLLTPGLSMSNEEPGFFRFVFTAASDNEFQLALQRLSDFVAAA